MKLKVAHLTSVHSRFDTRIFIKQCTSLTQKYEVHLVVADGLKDSLNNNIYIHDIGAFSSRKKRIINAPIAMFEKAMSLNADLYHIHDPELLPIALILKQKGKTIIFDAHEDFPKQLLSKSYLNPYIAKIMAVSMKYFEKYACPKLDAIISATPTINNKFSKFSKKAVNINNYPILGELKPSTKNWDNINNEIAYIGNITKIRGIKQVVDSLPLTTTNTFLNLGGDYADHSIHNLVKSSPGWSLVNELGHLDRIQVRDVLQRSIAGIVTFLPAPNHIDAQPNKMFEYMSAGLPVIASNFPLWVDIIEGSQCGICVNPENPKDIAKAIDLLVSDKELSERMGRNGIKAVNEKYNWQVEEKKLLKLYEELLG